MRSRLLVLVCIASVSSAAESVDLNGGLSWNGWTPLGASQDPGVFFKGPRDAEFELYYTSFWLNSSVVQSGNRCSTAVDFSAGSFQDGDAIVGIGVRWSNTQSGSKGNAFVSIDRNGTGAFANSTALLDAGLDHGSILSWGSGAVSFAAVGGQSDGCFFSWDMIDSTGAVVSPAGMQFQNEARDFWGQSFPAGTYSILVAFHQALPFRGLGVAEQDGGLRSFQWFVNTSAFERANAPNMAPYQAFQPGWAFALTLKRSSSLEWSTVVGRQLSWLGVAFDAGGRVDSGVVDSGVVDSGVVDSGVVDSGVVDSRVVDGGVVDGGVVDGGGVDFALGCGPSRTNLVGCTHDCPTPACEPEPEVPSDAAQTSTLVFESTSCGCQGAPGTIGVIVGLVSLHGRRRRTHQGRQRQK
jgi:hypothetical protein